MKGLHSNEQTSLGVLMTPAQKAAAEIVELGVAVINDTHNKESAVASVASIIQSALLAKEEGIAKLREALEEMTKECRFCHGEGFYFYQRDNFSNEELECPNERCIKARQALSRDTTGDSK